MKSERVLPVIVACTAKVNLGLSILGKRADGYHEIETVFQAIDWEDELSVSLGESGDVLTVDGPFAEGVPTDGSNLVLRALEVLRGSRSVPPLAIRLTKNIPHGSGLGGGSSDVAGVLLAANELCSLGLSTAELVSLAARVGSDTAFFVRGGTQWGRGRGEVLRPISANPELSILVVVPAVSVSTREAYGAVSASDWGAAFDGVEVEEWLKNPDAPVPELGNVFEGPVGHLYPDVAAALKWLRNQGALQAFLSGSGSACVGLFGTDQEAMRVASQAPSGLRAVRVCRFLQRGGLVSPISG